MKGKISVAFEMPNLQKLFEKVVILRSCFSCTLF